jgi:outer membrane protein assembly factor BamD
MPRALPLLLVLVTMACGAGASRSNLSYGDNARRAYEEALADFRNDNCLDAEPSFRAVRRRYPYSRFAALAELRVADCLFMQGKYSEAIQAYRQFGRHRPSHRQVPYARFRLAESYVEQIPEDWFLSPPPHELDQGPTREALSQIRRFLVDFPDDVHVPRARSMARHALSVLARHELYVAEFYLDRNHPRAAVRRLETLLRAFEGSGVEPEALLLLGRTYVEMRERERARETLESLVERFPRSTYAVEARIQLRELGG